MFGGKTTRMLAALERYQYQNRNTILFKPKMDRRYSEETVVTHKGQEHKCVLVETFSLRLVRKSTAYPKVTTLLVWMNCF
jgi:thymidine kinase